MFFQSSILLLAVIQVTIPGSQTTDPSICAITVKSEEQCQTPAVKEECPETCNCLSKDCSPPWQRVGEQCFQVFYQEQKESNPIGESWNVARVYCNVQDPRPGYTQVRLAVPDSIQTLYDLLADDYPYALYWIGASNLYKGEWYWNNGTDYNNTSPKSIHDHECLFIDTLLQDVASNSDGPIHNVGINGCWGSLPYVCEKY